jgi:hypothetical protein
MGSLDPPPSLFDPILLGAIERAFDSTWPVIRAHEAGANKARMAEISMALSHKLIELARDGVIDPEELRRLALESFPLPSRQPPRETSTDHLPEGSERK